MQIAAPPGSMEVGYHVTKTCYFITANDCTMPLMHEYRHLESEFRHLESQKIRRTHILVQKFHTFFWVARQAHQADGTQQVQVIFFN